MENKRGKRKQRTNPEDPASDLCKLQNEHKKFTRRKMIRYNRKNFLKLEYLSPS